MRIAAFYTYAVIGLVVLTVHSLAGLISKASEKVFGLFFPWAK